MHELHAIDFTSSHHNVAGNGTAVVGYQYCSIEGDACACKGLMRYGAYGKWSKPKFVQGKVSCTDVIDPAPNMPKICQCKHGTEQKSTPTPNAGQASALAAAPSSVSTSATAPPSVLTVPQPAAATSATALTLAAAALAPKSSNEQETKLARYRKQTRKSIEALAAAAMSATALTLTAAASAPKSSKEKETELAQYRKQTRKSIQALAAKVATAAKNESKVYTMSKSSLLGKARVLYGIATCSAAGFPAIVDAVFDTWAQKLPREQLVIAGGLRDDAADGLVTEHTPCGDKSKDFWCKEAVLLWRAAQRAEALNAHWMCVSQEDKYIWTEAVDAELSKHNASLPTVFAHYGCAQHWKHHKDSKKNTVAAPKSWPRRDNCDSVNKFGSMCGGPTYFVSRGMLQGLVKGIHTLVDFLTLFRTASSAHAEAKASDVLSTCFFYDRMPDAAWRVRGSNAFINVMTGNAAARYTINGTADVGAFREFWRKKYKIISKRHSAQFNASAPISIHLNQGKAQVLRYMHELHAIEFGHERHRHP